jgi:hypothetical protein
MFFTFFLLVPYRSRKLYLNYPSYSIPTTVPFSLLFHSYCSSLPLSVPLPVHHRVFFSSSIPNTLFLFRFYSTTSAFLLLVTYLILLFPLPIIVHCRAVLLTVPFPLQLSSPFCSSPLPCLIFIFPKRSSPFFSFHTSRAFSFLVTYLLLLLPLLFPLERFFLFNSYHITFPLPVLFHYRAFPFLFFSN